MPAWRMAFLFMFVLERACRIQLLAQASMRELMLVPKSVLDGTAAQARTVTRGLGGQLAWSALLRNLDRVDPSYRN